MIMARSKKKTTLSPAVLGVVVVFGLIGAVANACGGADNTGTPAGYSVPSEVGSSDPTSAEEPAAQEPPPTDTGTGGGGGIDVNPPGNGYVSGPGVSCGLSGCDVHGPHIGWHR